MGWILCVATLASGIVQADPAVSLTTSWASTPPPAGRHWNGVPLVSAGPAMVQLAYDAAHVYLHVSLAAPLDAPATVHVPDDPGIPNGPHLAIQFSRPDGSGNAFHRLFITRGGAVYDVLQRTVPGQAAETDLAWSASAKVQTKTFHGWEAWITLSRDALDLGSLPPGLYLAMHVKPGKPQTVPAPEWHPLAFLPAPASLALSSPTPPAPPAPPNIPPQFFQQIQSSGGGTFQMTQGTLPGFDNFQPTGGAKMYMFSSDGTSASASSVVQITNMSDVELTPEIRDKMLQTLKSITQSMESALGKTPSGPAKSFLGVEVGDLTAADRQSLPPSTSGARVTHVNPDSPAAQGGLLVGDILLAIEGKPVTSGQTLAEAIQAFGPGSPVKVELLREGRRLTKTIPLGSRP